VKRFLLLAIVSLSIGQMSLASHQLAMVDQLELLSPEVQSGMKQWEVIQEEIGDPESELCVASCGEQFSLLTFASDDEVQAEARILLKCVMGCAADAYGRRGLPCHPFVQEVLKQQLESTEQPVAAE